MGAHSLCKIAPCVILSQSVNGWIGCVPVRSLGYSAICLIRLIRSDFCCIIVSSRNRPLLEFPYAIVPLHWQWVANRVDIRCGVTLPLNSIIDFLPGGKIVGDFERIGPSGVGCPSDHDRAIPGIGRDLRELLGICFWREGFEAAFGPDRMGEKGG
jgi:hypothetical protein